MWMNWVIRAKAAASARQAAWPSDNRPVSDPALIPFMPVFGGFGNRFGTILSGERIKFLSVPADVHGAGAHQPVHGVQPDGRPADHTPLSAETVAQRDTLKVSQQDERTAWDPKSLFKDDEWPLSRLQNPGGRLVNLVLPVALRVLPRVLCGTKK